MVTLLFASVIALLQSRLALAAPHSSTCLARCVQTCDKGLLARTDSYCIRSCLANECQSETTIESYYQVTETERASSLEIDEAVVVYAAVLVGVLDVLAITRYLGVLIRYVRGWISKKKGKKVVNYSLEEPLLTV
jgi:hypothetical protein